MLDVRYVGVYHQGDEIQYQVRALPQDSKRGEAEVLEPSVMGGCRTAHRIDHFLAYFHGRGEGFGIAAQYVAKIDYKGDSFGKPKTKQHSCRILTMEEVAVRREKKII